jgi:hypothetical protein
VVHENHRASKAENDWLTELFIEFTQMLRREPAFKIACFYEQKATDVGLLLKDVVSLFFDPGMPRLTLRRATPFLRKGDTRLFLSINRQLP